MLFHTFKLRIYYERASNFLLSMNAVSLIELKKRRVKNCTLFCNCLLSKPIPFSHMFFVYFQLPSYSISGYRIWYKELEGAVFDGKVVIPRMSDTVYLITGLVPDTKYEVKARMYSNAGNGPFSELFVVKTDTGELKTPFIVR